MYPLVLSPEVVSTFSFWHEGVLQKGISSGKELYGFYKKFDATQRQEAFSTAVSLSETGIEVCITCLPTEYKVWVSLRKLEQVALCFLSNTRPEELVIT
ncbi:hypothetical protein H6F90_29635 [Trichocoleus sp. FACHB-591]|uniref:hypothetical protein n=1 Tax=Trichocoleus sp. FACHB-591 TaxID=2692872 RepID=UPI00168313F9|nr:hypothetical protein [Trichocoleus sp. FACHB-591]MBD2099229.1 hypothetical protein [Trichocoleus sp. FACHB-591]